MPLSPVSSITRAATRKPDEPLNILTFPTHERYETGLAKTGHNFYGFRGEHIKDWKEIYAKRPDNYTVYNPAMGMDQIPLSQDFDLILSQNKFGQFQIAEGLARQLGLPLVSLEHTLPMPFWGPEQLQQLQNMHGDVNVFISEYSCREWGFTNNLGVFDMPQLQYWDAYWEKGLTTVIHHCVDTETFKPNEFGDIERENAALSVVNDWINRDWCCGFRLWQEVSKDLPVRVVGDTAGLSRPAATTEELVGEYANHRIFLNTSLVSPVPTALLEAMACGCACVSTATCMIPGIITTGENGFISNNPKELREFVELLMNDEPLAKRVGENARKTILEKFSEERFISEWNNVFKIAVQQR